MKVHERRWVGPDGKLQSVWRVDYKDPVTGKRKRENLEGVEGKRAAERAAEALIARRKAEADTGEAQHGRTVTLEMLLRLHCQRPGISPWTVEQERNQAANLTRLLKPDTAVASLKPFHLDRYATERSEERKHPKSEKKISPATVLKELKLLVAATRWGYDRDLIPSVRLGRLPNLAPQQKPARCLTPEEVERLLDACGPDTETPHPKTGRIVSPWLRQAVEFCFLSGLRRGELFRLTWGDVDLARGTLYARSKRGGARDVRVSPVYLSDRAVELLHLRRQSLGGNPPDSGLVFGIEERPRGGKGKVGSVETTGDLNFLRAVRRAAKRAGIERPEEVGVHTLRHSCGTGLIKAGATIPEAAAHLRHRDGGALLLRVYAHAHEPGLRAAAERLSQKKDK